MLIFITKEVDIVIIDINNYCAACRLKRAYIFGLFMGDLEY